MAGQAHGRVIREDVDPEIREDGEEGGTIADYDNCEVVEVLLPLVKFKQPSNEDVIINTASLAFVQATLESDEERESEESM